MQNVLSTGVCITNNETGLNRHILNLYYIIFIHVCRFYCICELCRSVSDGTSFLSDNDLQCACRLIM